MTDHDDAQLDAALEALARPEPPADHVAQVLARTGGSEAAGVLRPRWVLPIAATAVLTIGMTWQLHRQVERRLDAVMAGWDSRPYLIDGSQWGAPQEIDRPVLPPQAYWGMDAFTEFERLRPGARLRTGTQERRNTGTQGRSTGNQGRRGEGKGVATHAWMTETTPSESGPFAPMLPPIELVSIVPAPLVMAPLAPLEAIALTAIPLEPIAIDALIEEERP